MCSCDRSHDWQQEEQGPSEGLILPAILDAPPLPDNNPPHLHPHNVLLPPYRCQAKATAALRPGDYPRDGDRCTHFRKPWKEGATVTSRDKVYELSGCHIMPIQSVPSDYVIGREWASQPLEQLPPYTRRRHRPYKYEFMGAEFWPWTTLRAKLAAERSGTECRPESFADWTPITPRDPPAGPVEGAAKKREKGGEKGPCSTSSLDGLNPQARARVLLELGWKPNPWKKLWGATVNDNPIIHCANCNCYVLPPVRDLSYLHAHHEKSSCFKERGCYYNSYSSEQWRPGTGTSWNSDCGRFYREPPVVDRSYCRPPTNWWITEVRPPYVPPPPDYDLLSPSVGSPPKHSIYEINSVSRVASQWTL